MCGAPWRVHLFMHASYYLSSMCSARHVECHSSNWVPSPCWNPSKMCNDFHNEITTSCDSSRINSCVFLNKIYLIYAFLFFLLTPLTLLQILPPIMSLCSAAFSPYHFAWSTLHPACVNKPPRSFVHPTTPENESSLASISLWLNVLHTFSQADWTLLIIVVPLLSFTVHMLICFFCLHTLHSVPCLTSHSCGCLYPLRVPLYPSLFFDHLFLTTPEMPYYFLVFAQPLSFYAVLYLVTNEETEREDSLVQSTSHASLYWQFSFTLMHR